MTQSSPEIVIRENNRHFIGDYEIVEKDGVVLLLRVASDPQVAAGVAPMRFGSYEEARKWGSCLSMFFNPREYQSPPARLVINNVVIQELFGGQSGSFEFYTRDEATGGKDEGSSRFAGSREEAEGIIAIITKEQYGDQADL